MEVLTSAAIQRGLTTRRFGRPVIVHERVGSTNDEAGALAVQGASEGTTVIAWIQTGGRGRRGRVWLSPAGGLWLSVVLRPRVSLEQWPLVGLAASAGAAGAVREVAGVEARVKWPNDILVEDRKLGGVLIEASGTAAIAGIGINANVPPGALDAQKGGISLLGRLEHPVDLTALACAVLGQFERHYDLLHTDPDALLVRWREHDATLGRQVRVWGAQELEGVAEDVDDRGALLVRTPGGLRRVVAGDVSLRTAETPAE
jgi:BirA family biotin operon repressor/biotin-[acetyl-CoA-carboxylase] ligase